MADTPIGTITDSFGRSLNLNMDMATFSAKLLAKTKTDPMYVKNPEADANIQAIRDLLDKIKDPLLKSLDALGDEVAVVVDYMKKAGSHDKKTREKVAEKGRRKPTIASMPASSDAKRVAKDFTKSTAEKLTSGIEDASKSITKPLKYTLFNEVLGLTSKVLKGTGNALELNVMNVFNGMLDGVKKGMDERLMLFSIGRTGKKAQEDMMGGKDEQVGITNEVGMSMIKYREILLKENMKGFTLEQKGNKLEIQTGRQRINYLKSVLHTGNMLGISGEEIASTFTDFNQQVGISSQQLPVLGRSMEQIAAKTGVTGKNLMDAVNATKQLVKNVQGYAGISAQATAGLIEANAIAKKFGVEKQVGDIFNALSEGILSLSKAAPETSSLITRVMNNLKIPMNQLDTLVRNPKKMKEFFKGMNEDFSKFLSQQGLSGNLATINDELDAMTEKGGAFADKAMGIRATIKNVYGFGAGDMEQLAKSNMEMSKTSADRIAELQKQMAGAGAVEKQDIENRIAKIKETEQANKLASFNEQLIKQGGNRQKALAAYNAKNPDEKLDEGKLSALANDYTKAIFSRAKKAGLKPEEMFGMSMEEVAKRSTEGSDFVTNKLGDLERMIGEAEKRMADPTYARQQQIKSGQNTVQGAAEGAYDALGEWAPFLASWAGVVSNIASLAGGMLTLLAGQWLLGVFAKSGIGKAIAGKLGGSVAAKGIEATVAKGTAAATVKGVEAATAKGAEAAVAKGALGTVAKGAAKGIPGKGMGIASGVITAGMELYEGKDVTTAVTKGTASGSGAMIGGILGSLGGPAGTFAGSIIGGVVADGIMNTFEHDVAANSASVATQQDKNFRLTQADVANDSATLQYKAMAKQQGADAALLQAQKDLEVATAEYDKQQKYFEDWRVGVGGGGGMTAFFARFRSDQAVIDETAASQEKMMKAKQRVDLLREQQKNAEQTLKEATALEKTIAKPAEQAPTKETTLTDVVNVLNQILQAVQGNKADMSDDFMEEMISFAEQGQEKGSIYTHDIHLEKILTDMKSGTSSLSNQGLFDKDNVSEAIDKGKFADSFIQDIMPFPSLSRAIVKNLGLFDPMTAKDYNDENAKKGNSDILSRGISDFGNFLRGDQGTPLKGGVGTGDGLSYTADYKNLYSSMMPLGEQKGEVNTNLMSTNEDIVSLIEREKLTSETDNGKIVSEIRKLTDMLGDSQLMEKVVTLLEAIKDKKNNIEIKTTGSDNSGSVPSSNKKINRAIMKSPGWTSLQDPVYNPSMANTGLGIGGR